MQQSVAVVNQNACVLHLFADNAELTNISLNEALNKVLTAHSVKLRPGVMPVVCKEQKPTQGMEVEHWVPGEDPILSFELRNPPLGHLLWLTIGKHGSRPGDYSLATEEFVRELLGRVPEPKRTRHHLYMTTSASGCAGESGALMEIYKAHIDSITVQETGSGLSALVTMRCEPDFTVSAPVPILAYSGRMQPTHAEPAPCTG